MWPSKEQPNSLPKKQFSVPYIIDSWSVVATSKYADINTRQMRLNESFEWMSQQLTHYDNHALPPKSGLLSYVKVAYDCIFLSTCHIYILNNWFKTQKFKNLIWKMMHTFNKVRKKQPFT